MPHHRFQRLPLKDDEFASLIGQNVFAVIERVSRKGRSW